MNVLILESVPGCCEALRPAVADAVRECVVSVSSVDAGQEAFEAAQPDALFVVTTGNEGPALALVRRMRANGVHVPVIAVVEKGAAHSVRDAVRAGAQDVLFAGEVSQASIAGCLEGVQRRRKISQDIAGAGETVDGEALIGQSEAMQKVRRMVSMVAGSQSPVLILGETGVGKGLVARAIHLAGPRRHLLYRAVNCAATPASLMESVMYGHERGSFTGAFRRQRGQFEVVGAGTILLDEVAEVPSELQTKLLRAVEERFFQPLGAENEVAFAGRIIASTNADLRGRMEAGRFRPDLFYRLSVLRIRIPTLAERAEDIPELIESFSRRAQRPIKLSRPAVSWLSERHWPGNVRELKNAVERLSVLFPAREVGLSEVVEHIDDEPVRTSAEIDRAAKILSSLPGSFKTKIATLEASIVRRALEQANGNRSAAARVLGVDRRVVDRVERVPRQRNEPDGTTRDRS